MPSATPPAASRDHPVWGLGIPGYALHTGDFPGHLDDWGVEMREISAQLGGADLDESLRLEQHTRSTVPSASHSRLVEIGPSKFCDMTPPPPPLG